MHFKHFSGQLPGGNLSYYPTINIDSSGALTHMNFLLFQISQSRMMSEDLRAASLVEGITARVVPEIRLAGYLAFFYIRYPAGYMVSFRINCLSNDANFEKANLFFRTFSMCTK